jgi:hypothetical protein
MNGPPASAPPSHKGAWQALIMRSDSVSIRHKVKEALDETRLLILGAQVLFGFKLTSVFQEGFAALSPVTRIVDCVGQFLMALAIGLLIVPSMQHHISEEGRDTPRLQRATGLFTGAALLPFGISLSLGLYIVFDRLYGTTAALVAGIAFLLLALGFWYGLEFALKIWLSRPLVADKETQTPLPTKIDHMLTEARLILPGAQALLGFQLIVTLTRTFEQLPELSRFIHVAALCCVALVIILLMTPAALHRISFGGEDTETFFQLGSWLIIIAPIPLAVGIALDLYVAISKASESPRLGTILAFTMSAILVCLWYAYPLYLRARDRRTSS